MKSLNLTLTLVFCYLASIAQQYVPMPTSSAFWRYRHFFSAQSYNYHNYFDFLLLQTGEDTTINGMVYKKIMNRSADTAIPVGSTYVPPVATVADQPDRFFGGLRENNKKVYIYRIIPGIPPEEKLLYDFTAAVGDTIPFVNLYTLNDSLLEIKSIDSVQVGTTIRKRYNTERIGTSQTITIIEGIGYDLGLIGHLIPPIPNNSYQYYTFNCFSDGAVHYSPDSLNCSFMFSSDTPVDVGNVKANSKTSVYPIPFSNTLTIEAGNASAVVVYNMVGSEVMRQPVNGKIELQTGHLQAGIYFLKLSNATGEVMHTQRLLKE